MCKVAATAVGPYGKLGDEFKKLNDKLESANLTPYQMHHILQHARVAKEVAEGVYVKDAGLALALFGGWSYEDTPHAKASGSQYKTKNLPIGEAGKAALLAAGCSKKDADKIVKAAEAHLEFLKLKRAVSK